MASGVELRELSGRLERIERVFDLGELSTRGLEESEIADYYERSAFAYSLIHCSHGSVHMAFNPDGKFDKDGYYGPVREVERRIPPSTTAVLELAVGKGFNISYLADRHPTIDFSGVDLTPTHTKMARKKTAHLHNVRIHQESFQRLPFPTASFDVVYVVESLCYATDMPRALSEARRVLRPGGTMIVIDGWRTGAFGELPEVAQRAAVLAEKAMSVGNPWTFPDWLGQARRYLLEPVEEVDFGPSIMPNLRRFERMAIRYFHHLSLARLSARVLPAKMLSNAIAGYLMPFTVRAGAHTYRMISLRASGDPAA